MRVSDNTIIVLLFRQQICEEIMSRNYSSCLIHQAKKATHAKQLQL
jgi:hypothetical protein